ncbi:hypothetical protein CVO77_05015 [Sphingopyxis lindanitolerans]|uniref:TonB C-terminal domain-containing protein n=1 Tax=Sphingopyxis lindanitolerans TaxID=2054227 RepID=A0A2S8B688_9SPHN|nr:energy transducer TonB [Sphingopyxis lindanitolerans]PQM27905.1 hypothetical protein CVO77_05015 [Sphingopyxis lindanitolerans]
MIAFLFLAALQAEAGSTAVTSPHAPQLLNPKTVLSNTDYPGPALQKSQTGIVSILLHVSPEGRVSSCDVTESSGFPLLDAATCRAHKARARFTPATDAAGAPIAGSYRTVATWGVGDDQPHARATFPLQVSQLPASYKQPVELELLFGATGHVTACNVKTTSGSGAADRAACDYLDQQLIVDPPKSGSDGVEPVAVRTITAVLTVDGADKASR